MSGQERTYFQFPQILRIQLHAFSLYSVQPNISLHVGKGVTCLAGANGIGKSTFLATLNYALTGAVPAPDRYFLSTGKYLEEALKFTEDFFEGRVSEADRDVASVSVEFKVGGKTYYVRRGLFDPGSVRDLRITNVDGAFESFDELTDLQKDTRFREEISNDVGVTSFEQFVFLQHFLLTFDEGRHLLFWDQKAIPQMLYLCFGGDPLQAAKADQLNREMERAGSWGRNLQFQANNLNKKIQVLEQTLAGNNPTTPPEDLTHEYAELNEQLKRAIAAAEEVNARLKDSDAKATQAAAAVASARAEYNLAFDTLVSGTGQIGNHPIIRELLDTCICPICRTASDTVVRRASESLSARHCPLCDAATLTSSEPEDVTEKLQTADAKLSRSRRSLDDALTAKDRLTNETSKAWDVVQKCRDAISSFETQNEVDLDAIKGRLSAATSPIAETLKALIEARAQLTAQREEAYSERDKYREQLRGLQQDLERQYATAERMFVPKFRTLAELFLGIDLDVSLATQSTGMKLELEMRGDSRRHEHQLSESQRFFVDIALRMALAQHISASESPASLLIDTPEGSLDIAYEDRAGEMFAKFVQSGHQMLMTANINTSKLLTTMARSCGSERMRIVQMTGWTELSDVQQRAGHLFQNAFSDIEAALQAGPHELA